MVQNSRKKSRGDKVGFFVHRSICFLFPLFAQIMKIFFVVYLTDPFIIFKHLSKIHAFHLFRSRVCMMTSLKNLSTLQMEADSQRYVDLMSLLCFGRLIEKPFR